MALCLFSASTDVPPDERAEVKERKERIEVRANMTCIVSYWNVLLDVFVESMAPGRGSVRVDDGVRDE